MRASHQFSIVLETPRLYLFTAEMQHAPAIHQYLVQNKAYFIPWMTAMSPSYFTEIEQLKWVEHDLQLLQHKRKLKFYYCLKTDTNKIIGDLSFTNILFGGFLSCFLGYKQDEASVGNGYMKEAIAKALEFVFEEWHLHRVEANIVPRNHRSIKLIRSLDFEEEGLSRKYLKLNGVWEDHIHFVKINEAV